MKERGEQTEKRERKREDFYIERLQLLSKFFDDRTVKLQLGKKQSWSPLQELHVGTDIVEFQQIPRGRGLLLLGLFSA